MCRPITNGRPNRAREALTLTGAEEEALERVNDESETRKASESESDSEVALLESQSQAQSQVDGPEGQTPSRSDRSKRSRTALKIERSAQAQGLQLQQRSADNDDKVTYALVEFLTKSHEAVRLEDRLQDVRPEQEQQRQEQAAGFQSIGKGLENVMAEIERLRQGQ